MLAQICLKNVPRKVFTKSSTSKPLETHLSSQKSSKTNLTLSHVLVLSTTTTWTTFFLKKCSSQSKKVDTLFLLPATVKWASTGMTISSRRCKIVQGGPLKQPSHSTNMTNLKKSASVASHAHQ